MSEYVVAVVMSNNVERQLTRENIQRGISEQLLNVKMSIKIIIFFFLRIGRTPFDSASLKFTC